LGAILWLILLSPIWIPVALLGAVLSGLCLFLGWLRLLPLYAIHMLTFVAIGHLLREHMAVDDSAITVRGLLKTRRITWHEIAQIIEVFSPPANTFKLVFNNGEELAFGAFAEIQPVLQAAPGRGVTVLRQPKPGSESDGQIP